MQKEGLGSKILKVIGLVAGLFVACWVAFYVLTFVLGMVLGMIAKIVVPLVCLVAAGWIGYRVLFTDKPLLGSRKGRLPRL